MRKTLRIMAILAAFGLTAWIGVVAFAQSSPTQAPATSSSSTVSSADDVEGNCDEAEHAGDPECLGVVPVAEDNNDDQGDNNDDQGENENADDQAVSSDDAVTDDQGDVNDDNQGESNDDQGEDEGSDDQGDNNDDQGENSSGPSDDSGPSDHSGSGSDDQGGDD